MLIVNGTICYIDKYDKHFCLCLSRFECWLCTVVQHSIYNPGIKGSYVLIQRASVAPFELNRHYNPEELYFMLLVTLAVKTVLPISQNGINQIKLNKQLGKHLNMDIKNASREID
jgi:hypothetical protein